MPPDQPKKNIQNRQVLWARRDHPTYCKGDDLCTYGRTGVVGEKGSGYRLPRWEAGKRRASQVSGPQSDFKINEN